MTPRRELTAAVVAAGLAGALGLLAGARPWVDLLVVRAAPLPPAESTVSGGTVSPLVPGLALVVLAAAVGLLATRRWGRVAIGVLVLLAGAGMLLATVPWLGGASAGRLTALAADIDLPTGAVEGAGRDGPVIALVAGVLAVLIGLMVTRRSTRWPAMGARYEVPVAAPPVAAGQPPEAVGTESTSRSERELWDALDRGEDPTAAR